MESNPENNPPDAASELNNLLQIISGTSFVLESIYEGTEGAEKYMTMLRESIERAEKITAQLTEHAGGVGDKKQMHPELAAVTKVKSAPRRIQWKQSILVVDDEPMILALSKETLEDAGFSVVTVQSGFECIERFREQPGDFDLILLDFRMPLLNGEETFERIRAIRPDMPVVMCTGFLEKERSERLMSAGLSGILLKPFRAKELASYLCSILDNIRLSGATASRG